MRLLRLSGLAAAAVLPFAAGCTQLYTIEVESTREEHADLNLDAKSYHIVNFSQTANVAGAKTLRQKEAEKILKDALAVRGMYEAPGREHCEVILDVQYGVAPARLDVTNVKRPVVASSGNAAQGGHIVGYVQGQTAEVRREKYLQITARANVKTEGGAAPPVIWTVSVRDIDEESDLRTYLPILAEVAADWSSRNTHGTRSFTATLENGVLVYVSGGYEQPGISPFLPK